MRRVPSGAVALVLGALLAWLAIPGPRVSVDIPPGLSAKQTASLLAERGVIRSRLLFRAAAKAMGADRRLKPGLYSLRCGQWLPSLLRQLEAGSNEEARVVIPEGFSAGQIARRLEADGVCKASDFELYVSTSGAEGYLFPTTYFFDPDTPAPAAAERMIQEFKKKVEPVYAAAQPRPRLTLHQILTLASIVEREAVLKQERPMIAAVYLNRLRLRMPLQADPTVQYALGYWKKGLTRADLRTPSAYNTYLHYGLPPGPICSPGLASFEAVLHPADTQALYFVANMTGGHTFSMTEREQINAKNHYKRELRAAKARLRRQGARE